MTAPLIRFAAIAGVTYGVVIDDVGAHTQPGEWLPQAERALPEQTVFGGWIRALHHSLAPHEGHQPFEEPAPKWRCETFATDTDDPADPHADAGHGILAAAQVLRESGRITIADRRETVALATASGVRDVLFGVGGVACDLGRWRLAQQGSGWLAADLAGQRVHARVGGAAAAEKTPEKRSNDEALIKPETITVTDGVGTIHARVLRAGQQHPSSGLGACAAALLARRTLGVGAPHHWAVMLPGGKHAVRLFPTEEGEHVSLSVTVEVQPGIDSLRS